MSHPICEYCQKAHGFWEEEAGYICNGCFERREAKKQAERDKYDERESQP